MSNGMSNGMSNRYPDRYQEDEEMYVYDQCCGNCGNRACPMLERDDANIGEKRRVEKLRKEDAIECGGEINWCIYWQQKGRWCW
jgi:hypothetical protein